MEGILGVLKSSILTLPATVLSLYYCACLTVFWVFLVLGDWLFVHLYCLSITFSAHFVFSFFTALHTRVYTSNMTWLTELDTELSVKAILSDLSDLIQLSNQIL